PPALPPGRGRGPPLTTPGTPMHTATTSPAANPEPTPGVPAVPPRVRRWLAATIRGNALARLTDAEPGTVAAALDRAAAQPERFAPVLPALRPGAVGRLLSPDVFVVAAADPGPA